LISGAAALASAALAWGAWHAHTHAHVHVAVNDVALKTPQRLWAPLPSGEVALRDAAGRTLAHGRVTAPYGSIEFSDAAAGDCARFEREAPFDAAARAGWQSCYEGKSRWQATWASDVADARVSSDACVIDKVPVRMHHSSD